MPSNIDTIEVNGTEYVIVGPGGDYPVSLKLASDHGAYDAALSSEVTPEFRWLRTGGTDGYSYALAICLPYTDPSTLTYSYI